MSEAAAPPPMLQTWGRSAAGLIVRDRGRVLLQLRGRYVQYPGTWSIPGGAVERGETSLQAALRELREEAGVRAADLRVTDRVHVAEPVAGWTYTTHVAKLRRSARGIGTPPPSAEAARHAWVPIADVAERSIHPGFAASWPEVRALLRAPRPLRVLFVCHGNLCRSALAEVLLRRMAAEAGVSVEVSSAGIHAHAGAPMDPGTAACAARHGLDGSAHFARQLDARQVAAADVVVALAFHVAPVVERLAADLPAPPTILERPALNPWRRGDFWQEHAYREVAATCAHVLGIAASRRAAA